MLLLCDCSVYFFVLVFNGSFIYHAQGTANLWSNPVAYEACSHLSFTYSGTLNFQICAGQTTSNQNVSSKRTYVSHSVAHAELQIHTHSFKESNLARKLLFWRKAPKDKPSENAQSLFYFIIRLKICFAKTAFLTRIKNINFFVALNLRLRYFLQRVNESM